MNASLPKTPSDADLRQALRHGGPMNLERAYQVMDAFGLDGLVLGDPINVFHITGHWTFVSRTRPGMPPIIFVLLTRDRSQPPGLVAPRFYYYYTYVDAGFSDSLQTVLYADAGDLARGFFEDRGEAPLSPLEQHRRAAVEGREPEVGGAAAVTAAMRGMGLWRGRIGYDHRIVADICTAAGHPGELVQSDRALRQIRLIKSPLEVALMRRASAANVAAVHTMAEAARAGATFEDLRREFAVAAARGGNQPVSLAIDRVSTDIAEGVIHDGQAFLVDAVSSFQGYHGDYGRTIVVGDPVASVKRAIEAVALGWAAVREQLRPGLRYSEVGRIGREAVEKAGYDHKIAFSPHSIGLMHTDEPVHLIDGFHAKQDLMLEEGMVISVDCPLLETGAGGSAHVEDITLITADGSTPLHAVHDAAIVV